MLERLRRKATNPTLPATSTSSTTASPYYPQGFGYGYDSAAAAAAAAAHHEGFDMEELDCIAPSSSSSSSSSGDGCVQPAEVMLEHGGVGHHHQHQHHQHQQHQQLQHHHQHQSEFDWKEWDQVFGRFVEVEEMMGKAEVGSSHCANNSAGWGLLDSEV